MYNISTKNKRYFQIDVKNITLKYLIHSILLGGLTVSYSSFAEEYFNLDALEAIGGVKNTVSLEDFAVAGSQAPGKYRVDIYLNDNFIETRDINFVEEGGKLMPQLSPRNLTEMGVKTDAFSVLNSFSPDALISDPGKYIPSASSSFNFGSQRLDISIPQAALTGEARDFVDPALWDQGMPALFLDYNLSGADTRYENKEGSENNLFLSLNSGINLGAWRLRNYSTWSQGGSATNKWNNINTYLQRDVQSIKGRVVLGDSNTPSDVFDSVQYRGAQLSSDDNMLPDSMRGFAPVVRGIAQSNAQVTISQNGYIIYQTYVAPGAFAISDLYPTSSGGNLEVTVKEADGTERKFTQPFSAAPIMQREGHLKYALTVGRYRSVNSEAKKPTFGQATVIYGLPKSTTIYGGMIAADSYKSGVVGIGQGFGDLGSLSFDITHANASTNDNKQHQGQSYRIQYAKSINSTGTSVTLAGYRYSTSGFYDFQEANELLTSDEQFWSLRNNKRSKTQLNLTQSLGSWGSIYASGYQQGYWGLKDYERNLSVGYNVGYAGITYSLSYTWNQMPGRGASDQQFALGLQVPLSKWLPNNWVNYNVNSNKRGDTSQQLGISGTALADNRLNYNLQQSYTQNGNTSSSLASATYKGRDGIISAGYNHSSYSQQINYGLQGAVVAHPYGITLAQPLGDTFALVRAPGTSDVKIQNNSGISTDIFGNAIVPYVSSYRKNRIALETESLNENVDIDTKIQTVIPTQGAIVLANFKTRVGMRGLIVLNYKGRPVPFGATAVLENAQDSSGIVGSDGEVYISGLPEISTLNVKWGPNAGESCHAQIKIPENEKSGLVRVIAECRS